jgi:hypothetical protein
MALAREFKTRWTVGQYDELIEKVDFGGRGGGVLFHWASPTDDGVLVVDVYESREAADRFARDRFGPASQQLGMPMPEMTEYEVHNYVQPRAPA